MKVEGSEINLRGNEQDLESALLRYVCRREYCEIIIVDGKTNRGKVWLPNLDGGSAGFEEIEDMDADSTEYFKKHATPNNLEALLEKTRMSRIREELAKSDSYEVFFEEKTASSATQYYRIEFSYIDREQELICVSSTNITAHVTKTREQQELVKHSYELGEAAQNAKNNFFANMSHEIRTPLNAIVGMAEIAKMDVHNPKKIMECMDIMLSACQNLTNVVSNILDTSSMQSGSVKIVPNPTDIHQVLEKVEKEFVEGFKKPNQTFKIEKDLKHSKFMLDATRAIRVAMNLLNNAANFTAGNGEITLRVTELPGKTSRKGFLKIEIIDNGKGISEEDIQHVFEPFYRDHDTAENYLSGTGLGLSVVKSIVDAKGATIEITSKPHEGTTVTIVDPVEYAEEKKKVAVEEEDQALSGKRVLLVEDQPINMLVAKRMLERFGAQVDTAEHGRFAVEQFMNQPENTYALIFMDIQMPIMDGYEATRQIRSSGRADAETVKIIAMTANVLPEDIESAKESGMDAHIGKPILTDELKTLIVSVLD